MTVYKGCPYCDAVFEIGPDDDWPLKQHLLDEHPEPGLGPRRRTGSPARPTRSTESPDWPVEALCRRFHATDDAAEARRIAFAVLHAGGVSDGTAAAWFDLDAATVRRLREEVEAPDTGAGTP